MWDYLDLIWNLYTPAALHCWCQGRDQHRNHFKEVVSLCVRSLTRLCDSCNNFCRKSSFTWDESKKKKNTSWVDSFGCEQHVRLTCGRKFTQMRGLVTWCKIGHAEAKENKVGLLRPSRAIVTGSFKGSILSRVQYTHERIQSQNLCMPAFQAFVAITSTGEKHYCFVIIAFNFYTKESEIHQLK